MLPLACYLLAAGKTVAVEKAEPVYLRNEVAWKKLPVPRVNLSNKKTEKRSRIMAGQNRAFAGC